MKNLNENLIKLITFLKDGKFVSGNAIGEKLNITRTAVWKMIHQLESWGIGIQSVKGRGYRLEKPLILLETNEILKNIQHPEYKNATHIEIFASLPSTNIYLKDKKIPQNQIGYVCLAEQQSSGKARLNRNWHSPFGANLYFSCLYPFSKDITELSGLSLVVGLAVIKTLSDLGVAQEVKIKWPNDIMWHEQKLAGILIDILGESNSMSSAIIGIGLNINMYTASSQNIDQPWTSLYHMTKRSYDRNQIVGYLINNLFEYLQKFDTQGLDPFLPVWSEYDYLANKQISISNNQNIFSGIAMGINNKGLLLMKHEDNSVKCYSSGDTSIKKENL